MKKASLLVASGLAASMTFNGVSEAAQTEWMNGNKTSSFVSNLKKGALTGISCKPNGNVKGGYVAGTDVKISYNSSRKESSSFLGNYNRWAIGAPEYIAKATTKAKREGLKPMGSDSFTYAGATVVCVVFSKG